MTHLRHPNDSNAQNWTAEKLVSMSSGMSGGLLNEARRIKRSDVTSAHWSPEHLAKLGMVLSHGFHPGL